MPKLPPFALHDRALTGKARPYHLLIFFALFALPLFAIHLPFLALPFFWDEHGQFIPTALDLLRHGTWVARSTLPNVHPPGVALYLVFWYKLFGFSIPITRVAMLLLASAGLLLTFLLAIELSHGAKGAPAFLPPLFLLASPLFFTQSMMAQLDMPAMVFTLLALVLFLQGRYKWAGLASIILVLTKETGLVVPFVFFLLLASRKEWKRASYFAAPALALIVWLVVLHHETGYWLGNPGFAHYNVGYALQPVHAAFALVRHLYYILFAEFRWIGTLVLCVTFTQAAVLRNSAWRVTGLVSLATILLVSLLGGAELERYLLPVLPIFYIAIAVALTYLDRRWTSSLASAALVLGLSVNLFWNPPYPFPFENNFAMIDFVRLQQLAADFAEQTSIGAHIATAWPYTASLEQPDFGYVTRKHQIIETGDFHFSSVSAISPSRFDVLITYTRTWAPENGVISIPVIRNFLKRFYDWQPEISRAQCATLGLHQVASWELGGQRITIYKRSSGSGQLARLPL